MVDSYGANSTGAIPATSATAVIFYFNFNEQQISNVIPEEGERKAPRNHIA